MRAIIYMLACGTSLYFFISAILLAIGGERTVRRIKAEIGKHGAPRANVRFVLILPMLREAATVDRALRQFMPAIEEGLPIDVVIATTAREAAERDHIVREIEARINSRINSGGSSGVNSGGGDWDMGEVDSMAAMVLDKASSESFHSMLADAPASSREAVAFLRERLQGDTGTVVERLIEELNLKLNRRAFFHVEAPIEAKGKVGQMNAAVSYWRSLQENLEERNVYAGVYDADSRPDQSVFNSIRRLIHEDDRAGRERVGIFQQVSCYCQNMQGLKGAIGAVSIADALAQTRWALGFEFPLYESYSSETGSNKTRRLIYCVGHGCFVSLAAFDRIGGFPTCSPNDDLALGYLASAVGLNVSPVPVLDFCDVAPNPFASIRQSRFWYRGSARFDKDLEIFREQFNLKHGWLQRLWFHIDGRMRCFFWGWRGMLWLGSLLGALLLQSAPLALLLILIHLIYVQVGFFHTLSLLKRIPGCAERLRLSSVTRPRLLLSSLAASVAFIVRGLGPMTASLGFETPKPAGIAWKISREPELS